MLALQQAKEVQASILSYLRATFNFKDRETETAFYEDFIEDQERGIFKGPYVSIKLPFLKGPTDKELPLTIKPGFPPYMHQFTSFERLHSSETHAPQSTLVTTGTGSGKTESFLFPLLDYCHQHQDKKGIKVIIMYPMNALATDQAMRIAEYIHGDEKLKDKITAGLFIGKGKGKKDFNKKMSATNIIEDRDVILNNPPDILLTNFKMMDYGLMQNHFHKLWVHNLADPSLLKFIVLDEIHTYDGAQGSDVANLLRRLKLKLHINRGQLCPVGTSATMGSGENAKTQLLDYATKLFGEKFDTSSIIGESRMALGDFMGRDRSELDTYLPSPEQLKAVTAKLNESSTAYRTALLDLWQFKGEGLVALGEHLKSYAFMWDLLSATNSGIQSYDALISDLNERSSEFSAYPTDADNKSKKLLVESLLSLLSEAKMGSGKLFPLVFIQIQLWIKEVSSILRKVTEKTEFIWKDELSQTKDAPQFKALPPYFCRDCGASGWLGVKPEDKDKVSKDINQVYRSFIGSRSKDLYMLNKNDAVRELVPEYKVTTRIDGYWNEHNLKISEDKEDGGFEVWAVRQLTKEQKREDVCPECNSKNSLAIIGTKLPTLTSITTSQILASDLDDTLQKDRKVLAFSNSVQDAAHQAGFVEARNFRFTFRSSLQKVINGLATETNLTQLGHAFLNYWKEHSDVTGEKDIEAFYYRFFPDDLIGKARIVDYKQGKGFKEQFKREFDLRCQWEVFSEFGYNAMIGRTLAKTGASGVYVKAVVIQQTFDAMKPWMDENELADLEVTDFVSFVSGLLYRLRVRGGIDHAYFEKMRGGDLKLWSLNWNKDNRHFLNKRFGPRARFPRLVTTEADRTNGVIDSTYSQKMNWFKQYFIKCFDPEVVLFDTIINEFYVQLFDTLTEGRVTSVVENDRNVTYALEPSQLFVIKDLHTGQCNTCSHKVYMGQSDSAAEPIKCLNYHCKGSYAFEAEQEENYYKAVYNRDRSPRVYAGEHTGLLDRKVREELETDFKSQAKFNSTNALIATSTLEMGIDIGDLNVAFNNEIPPEPSNFLQRIGRAGRSTGTALITNFAKNQPHDQFYYSEPLDMMQGEVKVPGCFLSAKEILKRHYIAYCIDSWCTANPVENGIPAVILNVVNKGTDLNDPNLFFNRLITFIRIENNSLFGRFSLLYNSGGDIEASSMHNLTEYIADGSLAESIRKIFTNCKDEQIAISKDMSRISDYIKEHKLPESDPERIALENTKKSMSTMLKSVGKRNVIQFMTDQGILPNYSFPETGVSLNATVRSGHSPESDGVPEDKSFDIVRPGASGIKELAPDNNFYSQGNRFKVTGINMFNWGDKTVKVVNRFCSRCDHMAADQGVGVEHLCPKCGDESWSSESNVHTFVKLHSVKSFNFYSDSALNDKSDDRDQLMYVSTDHFKFNNKQIEGAYVLKNVPFGIEYVKDVELVVTNLGRSEMTDPNMITINEEQYPKHGFVVCKRCGKASSDLGQFDYKFHFPYCTYKGKPYQLEADDIFDEIFLFRSFQTEAIKILLPVQEVDTEEKLQMFKTGMELGLKKYYNGNPQHIVLKPYKEYNAQIQRFDRYIVMYDSIPGGTGYLSKVFNTDEFEKILRTAYKTIKNCTCKDEGKDGCYRCIFSYSNQYYRDKLSRAEAEQLFQDILDNVEDWEHKKGGIGNLTDSGQIEESELETRFVRLFKKESEKEGSYWSWKAKVVDGVTVYDLTYEEGNTKMAYSIKPQINLGKSEGIEHFTRTDFLITCMEWRAGDRTFDTQGLPKCAIYLDGYKYHASKENLRFFADLDIRMDIAESDQYCSWTLTWDDLTNYEKNIDDELGHYLKGDNSNNVKRLLEWLKDPGPIAKLNKKNTSKLVMSKAKPIVPAYPESQLAELLKLEDIDEKHSVKNLNAAVVLVNKFDVNEMFRYRILLQVSKTASSFIFEVKKRHDKDLNKDDWTLFWHLFNYLQFGEMKSI